MKKPYRSYACFFLYAIALIISLACTYLHASVCTSAPAHEVTASDYADFLNHVASTSDPHFFYNDAMSTDPDAACIVRVGAPGRWHYEVIAGRENFPIGYVNEFDEEDYCDWVKERLQAAGYRLKEDDAMADASLRSNLTSFQVNDSSSSPTLTLASAVSTSTSIGNFSSCLEEASGVAGIIALAAFGHQLMVGAGAEDTIGKSDAAAESGDVLQSENDSRQLSLDDFRAVLATHPNASRYIVADDGTIALREADLHTAGRNRTENVIINNALKTALTAEHSEISVDDLLHVDPMKILTSYPPLNAERLRQIFDRIDSSSLGNFGTQTSKRYEKIEDAQQPQKSWFQSLRTLSTNSFFASKLPKEEVIQGDQDGVELSMVNPIAEEKETEIVVLQEAVKEAEIILQLVRNEIKKNWFWFLDADSKKSIKQANEGVERAHADLQRVTAMTAVWQKVIEWKKLNPLEKEVASQEQLSMVTARTEVLQKKARKLQTISEKKYYLWEVWRESKPAKTAAAAAQQAVYYSLEAIASLKAENGGLAILQQEASEEFCKASDCCKSAAQTEALGKYHNNFEYRSFDYSNGKLEGAAYAIEQSAKALEQEIDSFTKAQAAEAMDSREMAHEWYNSAKKFRKTSDQWRRAAQTFILAHKEYGSDKYGWTYFGERDYENAAYSMEKAANVVVKKLSALMKMKEANSLGDSERDAAWREVVEKFQMAIDAWSRSNEYYAAQQENEGRLWGKGPYGGIAFSLEQAAEALINSITATEEATKEEAAENEEEAIAWRELVEQFKRVAHQRSQASEAYLAQNKEKGDLYGGNKLNWGAAYIRECAIESLQKRITCLNKARVARAAGREDKALLWNNVANRLKSAADERSNASDFFPKCGRFSVGIFHQYVAEALEKRIEVLEKIEEASLQGNVDKIPLWHEIDEDLQLAIKQWESARKANEQGDTDTAAYLGRGRKYSDAEDLGSASLTQQAIVFLEKRIEAFTHAEKEEIAGNKEIADAWRNLGNQWKEEADYLKRMSLAFPHEEKRVLYGRHLSMLSVLESLRWRLKERVDALVEAHQAKVKNNQVLAMLWRELAQLQAIEYARWNDIKELLLAKKYKQVREREHHYLSEINCAARQLQRSIDALIQSQEFKAEGKENIAAKWDRIAAYRKEGARYLHRSNEAYAKGNEKEEKKFNNFGWNIISQADELEEKLALLLAKISYSE